MIDNNINMKYYTVKDVIKLTGCETTKAYGIIRALNDLQIKEGTPRECLIQGKVSKQYFHEKLKI